MLSVGGLPGRRCSIELDSIWVLRCVIISWWWGSVRGAVRSGRPAGRSFACMNLETDDHCAPRGRCQRAGRAGWPGTAGGRAAAVSVCNYLHINNLYFRQRQSSPSVQPPENPLVMGGSFAPAFNRRVRNRYTRWPRNGRPAAAERRGRRVGYPWTSLLIKPVADCLRRRGRLPPLTFSVLTHHRRFGRSRT